MGSDGNAGENAGKGIIYNQDADASQYFSHEKILFNSSYLSCYKSVLIDTLQFHDVCPPGRKAVFY